ncbi:KCNC1 [Mytilus coruscus]|uniref:KCNC1 n=1 Tax=Mytilus coruscus TaxID=42192 RepID=A0A6J8EN77_MYTCO|nr:KCNC1 [Mytilus coruscus]
MERFNKKITQNTKEEKSNTIIINVGGEVFKTSKDHFKRFPKTRLADLDATSGSYEESTNSYFFDRNPVLFHYILDYYKSGQLHIPHNVCYRLVESELAYWQIEYSEMTDCCKKVVEDDFAEFASEESLQQEFNVRQHIYSSQTKQVTKNISNWRIRIWGFLDDQSSSEAAKVCCL